MLVMWEGVVTHVGYVGRSGHTHMSYVEGVAIPT